MSRLDWPAGFDRTAPAAREKNLSYQASIANTTEAIETEMQRLDPSSWRVSTGSGGSYTKANGLPKYNAAPDDPGVVLRWQKDGEQFAVACDAYSRLRDNLRTVYLWVHETRMRGQRPVETGESEFAAARLPPADDETEVVAGRQPAHEVLGVERDANDAEIRAAARERIKETHPDHGGSEAEFQRVQEARETLLSEGDE